MTSPTTDIAAAEPVARLRRYTDSVHQRLHVHPMLGLMVSAEVTEEAYRRFLQKQYGFYLGCKQAVGAPPAQLRPHLSPVLAWLEDDLKALGLCPHSLPVCEAVPAPTTQAQWLGFLYVKEGSLLGGQLMLKNVRAHLPEASAALRYLNAHGRETGRRWREVCALLNENLHQDIQQAEQSALRTFTDLEAWLE